MGFLPSLKWTPFLGFELAKTCIYKVCLAQVFLLVQKDVKISFVASYSNILSILISF